MSKNKELLYNMVNSLCVGLLIINKNGIIDYLNEGALKILDLNRESALDKKVDKVIPNLKISNFLKTNKKSKTHTLKYKSMEIIAIEKPIINNGFVEGTFLIFQKLDSYKEFIRQFDGESGTGKELFAHAIHSISRRSNAPFIKVNCGAIPYELLESELFGYEEGSFTGAKKGGKIGKFKAADGGTIFLDEIGDLPMNMQVKLLRVLQDKEIEKIGSNSSEKVDVRIITATNRDLEEMVSEGKFRLDLYYRLNVLTIKVPPLRERKDDIPILSEHLIQKISRRENIRVDRISDSALEYLKRYNWPGNVRELENILERAINFLDEETVIKPEHLPSKITGIMRKKKIRSLKLTLEEVERQAIIDSLIFSNGNKTKAASILDISRTSLYEKIDKYNIEL
ncbi:sigma 54-interacting transcriptional regulator [Anaerosalibacter bizertensis]|uniref:Sigma 54-interacting transcriptional regulator n=1 Tax=Anaerosalibacter bizertensis TaxID=932217 RepID=A0A9Q4FLW9_9FIRM|nr:sigma 54-interacting transcriptional regulator [Anaerosalibacter bizertensis]MBV1817939.1 sigma 54-interacting transcriptional regulator [Bacteroidales bacterium MSK.15.36]MCB5560129.1 sigma 54-interacting transcriptional regulator [Anaerosalibacter bizertensis]MCG4565015.1 sigma 54-interacting transcriptional regulator [Anaerosalibacter bizertensis]MCG4583394.1 sigma 54-interacting transcriptional regulator [Anaerosalibacter bizertensis]